MRKALRLSVVLFALLALTLATGALPTAAGGPETSKVVFQLVDEGGKPLHNVDGNVAVWVRADGTDYQTAAIENGRVSFDLREGVEYMAFLGLGSWPLPSPIEYQVTDVGYRKVTGTMFEACPYTAFIVGEPSGQVAYMLHPVQ